MRGQLPATSRIFQAINDDGPLVVLLSRDYAHHWA